MIDQAKIDWVRKVLGVAYDAETPAGPRDKLLPIWIAAKESADDGIAKLQDALREFEDDDLETIREYGLYGATTGQAVALMAALRTADSKGTADAYAKVVDAVEDFEDFLDGAPIVDLIEDNPFGVTVPLRKTLGKALAEIKDIAG